MGKLAKEIEKARHYLYEHFTPYVLENATVKGSGWNNFVNVRQRWDWGLKPNRYSLTLTIPHNRTYAVQLLKQKALDHIKNWTGTTTYPIITLKQYSVKSSSWEMMIVFVIHVQPRQKDTPHMTFKEKLDKRYRLFERTQSELACAREKWKQIDQMDAFLNRDWEDKYPQIKEKVERMMKHFEEANDLLQQIKEIENS